MSATHYRSSSKGMVPIPGMHGDHLANAIAKLERSRRDAVTLTALKAEQARRGATPQPAKTTISGGEAFRRVFGR